MPIIFIPGAGPGIGYNATTFLQLQNELSLRLGDPTQTFWTKAEIILHIQDAFRFWNCLTGDNKQTFDLPISSATPWYDLHNVALSPRLCRLTDADIYTRLQLALLEPPLANCAMTTMQFSAQDLVSAVQRKRDEFLFRTGCTSTIESLNVNPGVGTLGLPPTVIQPIRGYWLPQAGLGGQGGPILRGDEFVSAAYAPSGPANPGDPLTFSAGIEPPLVVEFNPPPNIPGKVEFITIESQAVLSAVAPTTLFIPSDFVPALTWGALADLLEINLEAKDSSRAEYARKRFEQYAELIQAYPFVFGARVNGIPVFVDAVETLDSYNPTWRTGTTPQSIIGLSGQNLVAAVTPVNAQITLILCANANVPVNDNDPIQAGQEILDCLLDYAQHVASFKMGGAEFQATLPLLASIVKMAAKRNAKVRALSTFREILYGKAQREPQFSPLEIVAEA